MRLMNLVVAIVLMLMLVGCWDRQEMEQQGFIIAIGIDKGKSVGDAVITYQIANPQAGLTNTGGEKEPSSEIITFPAPGLVVAKDMANISVARKVNYSHLKVIIISEAFAKDYQFRTLLDQLVRERELRRDAKVIVSKEKASDFIRDNTPKLETRPHKYYDLISSRWEETGFVPLSSVQLLLQCMELNQDASLIIHASTQKVEPVYGEEDEYSPGELVQKGGNKTQIIGAAVFVDGVMVGSLSGEEVRLSIMLKNKSNSEQMLTTYPDPSNPKFRISTLVQKQKKVKIRINTKKDPMEIHVKILVPLDILSVPSGVDYIKDLHKQEMLEESIESNIEKKLNTLIKRTQEEFKADPFRWSDIVRKQFAIMPDFLKYNFKEKYSKALVTVETDVIIKGFGKRLSPPSLKHN